MSDRDRWQVRKQVFPITGQTLWKAIAPIDNRPIEHRYFGGFHFDTHADAIEYATYEARRLRAARG